MTLSTPLDRLEGYREGDPASLYTREIVSWTDAHGMLRQAFMYVPSEASQERIMRGAHQVIESGDWCARTA